MVTTALSSLHAAVIKQAFPRRSCQAFTGTDGYRRVDFPLKPFKQLHVTIQRLIK